MIAADEYRFLQGLLHQHSGLSLGAGKEYLIESRLSPLAATYGLTSLSALVAQLRNGASATLVKSVCDAMTTGETLFFRDNTPFKVFRESLLPEAVARSRQHGRTVRIWCAACSTGQEPYSIAMLLDQDERQLAGVRTEIVATDFSSQTVARAKAGVFNQFEVQRGLPVQYLLKYFTKDEQSFRLHEAVKRRVTFREHNLLKSHSELGTFDMIFVRNVLIYFDQATKRDVLERMARQLAPGGCLVLGGTENTIGVTDVLTRQAGCAAPVYRRTGDPLARPSVPLSSAA